MVWLIYELGGLVIVVDEIIIKVFINIFIEGMRGVCWFTELFLLL